MSAVAAVAAVKAGIDIAQMIANGVVHYSKQQYMDKINRLQSCLTQLNDHRETLEGYKNQLKRIWDDEEAADYIRNIESTVKIVTNQHKNVQSQIEMWQKAIESMEFEVGQRQESLGDISGVLGALNIAD